MGVVELMAAEIEKVVHALKTGNTINAPASTWIAAHSFIEREMRELLEEATHALGEKKPLVRKRTQNKITDYLASFER